MQLAVLDFGVITTASAQKPVRFSFKKAVGSLGFSGCLNMGGSILHFLQLLN
jgi:hypothetical protein